MQHRMTYNNIRNMINQLEQSGGIGNRCFISGVRRKTNANLEMIEFSYSESIHHGEEEILCMMNHYENSYEILISVREILHSSNIGLQELNLAYIKLRSKDPYEVMDVVESPGYSKLRSSIHLITHKATRKLINRIYNRMMVPEMRKQVAERVRYELECFKKEAEEKG